ncbi:MAG: class I tRNA ligase family protein, partial [bacterium]|nr:class I tRNA ligase family protein [bacterium]
IADNADYLPTLEYLAGLNAKKHPEVILDLMQERGFTKKILEYNHRYPACWRCKTELVWKVADEWYIKMDELRPQLIEIVKQINWLPAFGLDRELDWLKNMHDWLISKKNRYWGLALPIYECQKCGNFEVIGSKDELKSRAVSGWDKFDGNSPHKPWIDEVKIKCSKCEETVSRILDVGNPWLDAGIVSFSTMDESWFPADFITESFPGQFKNWFYSLIVMGTVLRKTPAFKNVLGFGTLLGEDGRPMHKSWGNSIEFNEGADKIGVDVMRWMYATHKPEDNMCFGYKIADETRRKFYLMLWNIYSFFITYANLNEWKKVESKDVLDKWILERLYGLISITTKSLDKYDAFSASTEIEKFVNDFSTWYIRRSRDRMTDEFFSTCYEVLVTLCKLLAPFMPFVSEEMYRNLTGEESVHLTEWPKSASQELHLQDQMEIVRKICELGHAQRKLNNLKVRQPLQKITIDKDLPDDLLQLIKDELNVKEVIKGDKIELDTKLTPELEAEGKARDLVRDIQDARKLAGTALNEKVIVELPDWPIDFTDYIKAKTLAKELKKGPVLRVILEPEGR